MATGAAISVQLPSTGLVTSYRAMCSGRVHRHTEAGALAGRHLRSRLHEAVSGPWCEGSVWWTTSHHLLRATLVTVVCVGTWMTTLWGSPCTSHGIVLALHSPCHTPRCHTLTTGCQVTSHGHLTPCRHTWGPVASMRSSWQKPRVLVCSHHGDDGEVAAAARPPNRTSSPTLRAPHERERQHQH